MLGLQLNRSTGKNHHVKKISASDVNVRSKFSRSLVYSVNVQSEKESCNQQQHVLTDENPLLVTAEESRWDVRTATSIVLPSSKDWKSLLLLHIKDQRPLAKCSYGNDAEEKKKLFYINLSKCKYRDQLVLQNGMKLVLMDSTKSQCEIEFSILNGSDGKSQTCGQTFEQVDAEDSDADDSGESEDQMHEVEEGSSSPRGPNADLARQSQCACNLPTKSALKSGRSVIAREKSITWSTNVKSTLIVKTKDESNLSVKVQIDGEERLHLTSQERFAVFCGSSSSSTCDLPQDKVIRLALSSSNGIIFGVSIHDDLIFLTLPRLKSSDQDQVQVLLPLPPHVDYPIAEGDVLEYSQPGMAPLELRVDMGQLLRKLPHDDQPRTCQFNPAHAISEFAIETTYQGNNDDIDGDDGTGKVYMVDKHHFAGSDIRIGRVACDINLADRHVSRHHATIERRKGAFFLCRAESERRSIYLLLGRRDSHYRPPMSLRTGDEFRVGRSDFKVVYQQRGRRTINQTPQEEMIARMHVSSRPSNELKRTKFYKQLQREKAEDDKTLLREFGLDSDEKEPLMILIKLRGHDMGKYYLCHPTETTLGSSAAADISVPSDRKLSPLHARVFFDLSRERWVLQDLQSIRGTYMKFDRSDPPFLVAIGDVIRMGSTCVRILGKPIMPNSCQKECAHQ